MASTRDESMAGSAAALNRTLKAVTCKLEGHTRDIRGILTILEFMLTNDDTDTSTDPDPPEQFDHVNRSLTALVPPGGDAALSPSLVSMSPEPAYDTDADDHDGNGTTLNRGDGATSPTPPSPARSWTRASPCRVDSGSPDRRTPTRERGRLRSRKSSTSSDGADHLMKVPAEGEGLLALPREIHIRIFEFLTMFDAIKVHKVCQQLRATIGSVNLPWTMLDASLSSTALKVDAAFFRAALGVLDRRQTNLTLLSLADRPDTDDALIGGIASWINPGGSRRAIPAAGDPWGHDGDNDNGDNDDGTVGHPGGGAKKESAGDHRRMGLRALNLDGCPGVTDRGLAALGSSFQSLVSLRLSGCTVSDASLELVAEHCGSSLTHLVLSTNHDVSTDALRSVLRNCNALRSLHLDNCPRIEDFAFDVPGLRITALKVEGCHKITDGLAAILVHNAVPLNTFSVARCGSLTDAFVETMVDGVPLAPSSPHNPPPRPSFQSIDLSGCYIMTDAAATVLNGLPLKFLGIEACCHISGPALEQLAASCPRLEEVNVKECPAISRSTILHLTSLGIQLRR